MFGRLALRLLRLFATGTLHGTELQALAIDAWASGDKDQLTRRLAKTGAKGARSGNIARDIFLSASKSGLTDGVAQPYFFLHLGQTVLRPPSRASYRTKYITISLCETEWVLMLLAPTEQIYPQVSRCSSASSGSRP